MFPNEFKIIVDAENFEFVQRLLFMAGMKWTFSGQDVTAYNSDLGFSFLHIGRNRPGIIQMFHRRDYFDELDVSELIVRWI